MHRFGERAGSVLTAKNFDTIEALSKWAAARDRSLLELAFAWLIARPPVSSVLAGATSPAQVKANAAARTWRLNPEEVSEVDNLASAP
jgi:aryl-alcohol dehydrogenase-like predicted oxidoreductase